MTSDNPNPGPSDLRKLVHPASGDKKLPPVEIDQAFTGLNLTRRQAQVIAALFSSSTIKEALKATDTSEATWYLWRHTCPEFVKAVKMVPALLLDQANLNMDRLVLSAADKLEDALKADKVEECPSCRQAIVCANCNSMVTITNWNAVTKAIDMILKRQGAFITKHEVTGEITHTRELTHEQRVAVAYHAAGGTLPPGVEAELRAINALPDQVQVEEEPAEYVEGEVVHPEDTENPGESPPTEAPDFTVT